MLPLCVNLFLQHLGVVGLGNAGQGLIHLYSVAFNKTIQLYIKSNYFF